MTTRSRTLVLHSAPLIEVGAGVLRVLLESNTGKDGASREARVCTLTAGPSPLTHAAAKLPAFKKLRHQLRFAPRSESIIYLSSEGPRLIGRIANQPWDIDLKACVVGRHLRNFIRQVVDE